MNWSLYSTGLLITGSIESVVIILSFSILVMLSGSLEQMGIHYFAFRRLIIVSSLAGELYSIAVSTETQVRRSNLSQLENKSWETWETLH